MIITRNVEIVAFSLNNKYGIVDKMSKLNPSAIYLEIFAHTLYTLLPFPDLRNSPPHFHYFAQQFLLINSRVILQIPSNHY